MRRFHHGRIRRRRFARRRLGGGWEIGQGIALIDFFIATNATLDTPSSLAIHLFSQFNAARSGFDTGSGTTATPVFLGNLRGISVSWISLSIAFVDRPMSAGSGISVGFIPANAAMALFQDDINVSGANLLGQNIIPQHDHANRYNLFRTDCGGPLLMLGTNPYAALPGPPGRQYGGPDRIMDSRYWIQRQITMLNPTQTDFLAAFAEPGQERHFRMHGRRAFLKDAQALWFIVQGANASASTGIQAEWNLQVQWKVCYKHRG